MMADTGKPSRDEAFVVTRNIRVSPAAGGRLDETVAKRLEETVGVVNAKVNVERQRMAVTYDQTQMGFRRLQEVCSQIGLSLSGSRWAQMKWKWFDYLDRNAKANAQRTAACCSSPDDIYAGRPKR